MKEIDKLETFDIAIAFEKFLTKNMVLKEFIYLCNDARSKGICTIYNHPSSDAKEIYKLLLYNKEIILSNFRLNQKDKTKKCLYYTHPETFNPISYHKFILRESCLQFYYRSVGTYNKTCIINNHLPEEIVKGIHWFINTGEEIWMNKLSTILNNHFFNIYRHDDKFAVHYQCRV